MKQKYISKIVSGEKVKIWKVKKKNNKNITYST